MTAPNPASPVDLANRLLESLAGAMDITSIFLGEQLGYYRALHEFGPANSAELAQRTGCHERYTREWLEHQATTGFLAVESAGTASERRYVLPPGYEGIFVDPESDFFLSPVGRFLSVCAGQAPALVRAYREGGGISWSDMGDLARGAQADFNRPFFTNSLVPGYLSQIPGLDDTLRSPGARIAEIGCGAGWASVAMAAAYPGAVVDGFDLDGPSIEMARRNLAESGGNARVTFHHRAAAAVDAVTGYDLVCAFECIHDMPDPVSVLAAMRRLARPGALVLVMDENVGEEFGAIGDFNERLYYGYSITICLPDGMAHQPSVGTGTVMRPSTLRAYAKDAGFASVEILPLEHDLFRFYRLLT